MKTNVSLRAITAFLLFTGITSCAQQNDNPVNRAVPPHPRILLLKGEESSITKNIASDGAWNKIHLYIIAESNKMLPQPPVERVLIGRRLLDKSREALKRIFYLSYAWRMSSDDRYLDRAVSEMLAISAFSDWNPSHFLDVAEMTMAAAIGYDWLYNELSESSRETIRTAIIEKGLKSSLISSNNSWLTVTHNWNQVCNAGMTFGALAVYEYQEELAKQIIERAAGSIKLAMEDYQPDGAYPEGFGYWGYGTSFNVMYLSAMEKCFGSDFDIEINDGFLKTTGYLENMIGPTGSSFNYSDNGSGANLNSAMFWLANRLEDPSLLWSEKYLLLNKQPPSDRLLPAVLIWSAGLTVNKITAPQNNIWVGHGKNPVALMRSSWTDPNAIFAGLKAGSPSVNHGHMDAGSFIIESGGVRWAMDFGAQDYNSLESAGVNLWSMNQNSERWDVFRYNNFVHNTLTVNGLHQVVAGNAPITSYSGNGAMLNAITDLSSVYSGQLSKSERGIAIVENQYVMILDEVRTATTETVIRWNLLTSADVVITGSNTAELTKNGKKLILKVNSPSAVTMKTWSTVPPNSYDAANPGTIMVGFETTIPSNTTQSLNVVLLPEGAVEKNDISIMKLSEWPKTGNNK